MKCRKSLMGLAALLIMIFHFYIPVTKSPFEMAFYRASYIGVDLFFFVSAYSLSQREKISFVPFMKNRLCNVYVPFLVMAGICAVYKKWTWQRFLQVASGAELFMKGGGAFMWFIPGIMIFYLLAPFIVCLKKRYGCKAFAGMIAFWLVIVIFLQYGLRYTELFILLNRIPVFAVGLFYGDMRKAEPGKYHLPVILTGLTAGAFLMYKWGSLVRINRPIQEMYYVIAVPIVFFIVAMFDYVSQRTKLKNVPLAFLGRESFELYGLQMIFGYDIESRILQKTGKGYISFLCTMVVLIVLAYVFWFGRKIITKSILRIKEHEK